MTYCQQIYTDHTFMTVWSGVLSILFIKYYIPQEEFINCSTQFFCNLKIDVNNILNLNLKINIFYQILWKFTFKNTSNLLHASRALFKNIYLYNCSLFKYSIWWILCSVLNRYVNNLIVFKYVIIYSIYNCFFLSISILIILNYFTWVCIQNNLSTGNPFLTVLFEYQLVFISDSVVLTYLEFSPRNEQKLNTHFGSFWILFFSQKMLYNYYHS